jgi:NAD(P)-dependent dehydrogenase (short-subunit alcohol dehydrogenase family)
MGTIGFEGRVAIVTGAGGGLGRSHAMLLAARGARVVVNDLGTSVDGRGKPSRMAEQVAAEICAAGGMAVANGDDVATPAGAARLAEQARDAFGRIDILINNAGILRDKTFAKMDLADFHRVLEVHLLGTVYCTKAVWAGMVEQGHGRIVVTTSSSGLYGHFGQTNYDTAKLGLVGFMKALAQEGRRHGIAVNAIGPLAATRMSDGVLDAEVFRRMPPEHVSAVVAYLASDRCSVSGEVLVAGGGYLARAAVVESHGVVLPADRPSPEAVEAALAQASDLSRAVAYPDLASAFAAAAERLKAAHRDRAPEDSVPAASVP